MAITKTQGEHTPFGTVVIFSQTSAANTAQTCSTDTLEAYRILLTTVKYSAAPTQTGAITTLNSGLGAGYDTALNTGTANAQATAYQPSEPIIIAKADAIDVLAPQAGGTITSSGAIYCLGHQP